MESKIIGDDMQALVFTLAKGEKVMTEAGAYMYTLGNVSVNAELTGGVMGAIKRALTKESLFLVILEAHQDASELGLAAPYPGHIKKVPLNNSALICQRDAFLAATGDIQTDIVLAKNLGFGFFGGEGFILQKLHGTGDLYVHAGGNFVEADLKEGETIKIDTGCVVAFEENMNYDISSIGNIKTSLFAGEGIFVANIQGPGKVWLQTLPFSRMAEKIASAIGANTGESRGAAGFGGNFLKDIISGR
jgi:uncharacterized protein (TIGR00266 family)